MVKDTFIPERPPQRCDFGQGCYSGGLLDFTLMIVMIDRFCVHLCHGSWPDRVVMMTDRRIPTKLRYNRNLFSLEVYNRSGDVLVLLYS